jgi:ferrous iron transport protein B
MAVGIVAGAFFLVRFVGESLISYVFEPVFNILWTPVLLWISDLLGNAGYFHDILIGQFIGGEIDYVQSFGLLSSGLYVPLALVLPYVIAFYLVLGIS